MYSQQLRNLLKQSISSYTSQLESKLSLKALAASSSDFSSALQTLSNDSRAAFIEKCRASGMPGCTWSTDSIISEFTETCAQLAAKKKAEAMAEVARKTGKRVEKEIVEPVLVLLQSTNPDADLWKRVVSVFTESVEKAVKDLEATGSLYSAEEEEMRECVKQLKSDAIDLFLKKVLKEQVMPWLV